MSKSKRILSLYKSFSRAGMQNMFAYRANFFCFLIGEIMSAFILYFVWKAVFISSGGETFNGFSMNDMVVYIFVSFLASYMTYSDGAYVLGEEIISGDVTMRMIKPVSFDMCFLFQELGNQIVKLLFIFVPILLGVEIYRFVVNGFIMFNVVNFLIFFVSLFFAYLISFYFNVCYGYLAFYLQNLWGTSIVKETLVSFLSGGIIPLAFLPSTLSSILNLLPFASLSYTPVMIYMGKYSLSQIIFSILLQIFWLLFFYVLSKIIWKSAVRRLCANGG